MNSDDEFGVFNQSTDRKTKRFQNTVVALLSLIVLLNILSFLVEGVKISYVITYIQQLEAKLDLQHLKSFINTTETYLGDLQRCTSVICKRH